MNNPKAKLVIEELMKMTPQQMVEDPRIEEKFVTLYNNIHGSQSGEMLYHKAKFDFLRIVSEKQDVRDSTILSLYGCFLDAAVCGLSLEQGSKPHVYVIAKNFNVGTREAPKWEKRANMVVSPYGELVQRMRAGQIGHTDNPVIVYEGDHFQPVTDKGGKYVEYRAAIPRKSTVIVGAFIIITRLDGSKDCQWLLKEDVDRLKGYSAKQNKTTGANALYTSNNGQIDPGFLEAKMIKHAFDTYPKVRTGNFTTLATQQLPDDKIDYGIEDKTFEEQQAAAPVTVEGETVTDDDGIF